MTTQCPRINTAPTASARAWLFSLLPFVAPALAQAEPTLPLSEEKWEEVVVVGSYVPRPAREVGSAVTILTAEDIELRQTALGAELLREVPGAAVNRAGQTGALTQVRIRGAEGNHTLVFIDGIEANDPAQSFEYNFADLMTWDIERIEVLRGPQSALYGSEAIGGVVSLTTTDPLPGFHGQARVEGGSFGTTQYGATVSGGSESVRGLLSANRYDTDGISQSAIQSGEKDGYETTTLHGKVDVAITDRLEARLVVRHSDNEVETDRQDFDFPDTPTQGQLVDSDDRTESEQLYGLAELRARFVDDRWLHRLAIGYTDTESDSYSSDEYSSGVRGERRQYEYETTFLFGGSDFRHALTGGVEREEWKFENVVPSYPDANHTQDDDQTSFIAEYDVSVRDNTSVSVSVRHDRNDLFDDATTFRATGSYLFAGPATRVHASYGQGITNPSFFELFGYAPSTFEGNPDLEPEKSHGWDLGVEQALWDGRALVDVTYFDATLEDEIATVFDFTTFLSTPVNQSGESERRGIEVTLQARLNDAWSVRGSYTYLDATDPDGADEVRRPENTGSLDVNYAFLGGRGNVNVGALFNGEQQDNEFVNATPATRVTLDSYTLMNAAVTFDVTPRVQVFVRGENLLDEDYTEVFGFRSPGAAGYLGVRARL